MKKLITLLVLECFLVNSLHLEWAWAGERFSSAVEKRFACPSPFLLRPKAAIQDEALKNEISGTTAKDGGGRILQKSPQFHSSYAFFGRGLLTEIEGEEIEILSGELEVDPKGYLISSKDAEGPYSVFVQLLNRDEEPYQRTRRLVASLARHHHIRFVRGMKTLSRRETDGRVLIHASLVNPRYMPPKEIFWEFWVALLRSSAIRHDPDLVGEATNSFTAQIFGLLGEVGRLVLIGKEKRDGLKEYLRKLSSLEDFSIDTHFLERYMETVDEIEDVFRDKFIDLSRGTRHIYTNFALSLALPFLVRLLNPKGWPEEAFTDFVLPENFRISLSTELKRLRRTEEFQRMVRTIDGEGDPRVLLTAVIADIKMDARVLKAVLDRAVERGVDKIIMMGDIFGKSRGRSPKAASPLTIYDILREFEKTFRGRGAYLFGPDELFFLFIMMGYPGIDNAWYTLYGGKELLEARNKEIALYNAEQIRQKGEKEAELLEEVNMTNFRDDPRLKEMRDWIRSRFYEYHHDEFGIFYVNGGLPGALEGREDVIIADWDRREELIRTSTSFKGRVFQDIMDYRLSPVMVGDWKQTSQKLNLQEFLPSIKVDGEGGNEVVAVVTGGPNFNIKNRSIGVDLDDPNAEGGPGIGLRFVGRDGIVLDRLKDGKWESIIEESPESFLERVRENAKKRIQIVARDLPRQDQLILSSLRRHKISEESEALRYVKRVKNDVAKGVELTGPVRQRLIDIAEDVLYGPEERPDREELFKALSIEIFHGNILYNEETKEGILLVGREGVGRGFISYLLAGEKKRLGGPLYPSWTLLSQEASRLFVIGNTIFGGTKPIREIPEGFKGLYYHDKNRVIVKTEILPKEKIVEISRAVILTDERILTAGRAKLVGWLSERKDPTHADRVKEIIQLQREAKHVPSTVLVKALQELHIEKFHVGISKDIRGTRLQKIAFTIDADVGRRWFGAQWAAWLRVHFPLGYEFFLAVKELRRKRDFPPVEDEKTKRVEKEASEHGHDLTAQDGQGKWSSPRWTKDGGNQKKDLTIPEPLDDSDEQLAEIAMKLEQQGWTTQLVGHDVIDDGVVNDEKIEPILHRVIKELPFSDEDQQVTVWPWWLEEKSQRIDKPSHIVDYVVRELLKNIVHAISELKEKGQPLLAYRTVDIDGGKFIQIISRNLRGNIDDVPKVTSYKYSRLGEKSPGIGFPFIITLILDAFGKKAEVVIESQKEGYPFANQSQKPITSKEDYRTILDESKSSLFPSKVNMGTQVTVLIPMSPWSARASQDGGRKEDTLRNTLDIKRLRHAPLAGQSI